MLQAFSGRTGQNGQADSLEFAISQLAKEKREQLRKDWNVQGLPPAQRAGAERAIKSRVKQYLKPLRENKRRLSHDEQILLLRGVRESRILDRLYPDRTKNGRWLKLTERNASHAVPEIDVQRFSLLHDPRATISALQEIAEAESTAPGAKINFKDEYCLDVAPFILLAECWNEMLPIFEGGEMSLPMQKVLATIGVQYAMGIRLKGLTELSDVWAYPLMRRRSEGTTASSTPFLDAQTREIASDHFCDALNKWLSHPDIGVSLTDRGLGKIKNLLGELLENAERHSDGERRDGRWAVSGFMARRYDDDAGDWVYRAHLGIVSIGDSFSKSLERALPEVRNSIDEYVRSMRKKGAKQSDKTLRTLAALQDGVTCAADADSDNRGGFGLQEMLDIVSLLGETPVPDRRPRVTILSGASCIMLRAPYIRGLPISNDDPTRVLWCNPLNSKDEVPDQSFVFDLEPGLPGTVISVGFVLDPNYLKTATLEDDDDQNN